MICEEVCIPQDRRLQRAAVCPAVLILIAFVLVTTIAFAIIAAHSVQGSSDQFWYLTDVASLAHHSALSNDVFPATAGNSVGGRPAFIHNNLSLHLVGILARVLSPNAAWIYSNLICTLGAGIFLFYIVRTYVDDEMALLTSAFFLSFPLTVWQSCNALSECQHAVMIAGATWAMLCLRRGVHRTTLVAGFLAAAALMKDNLLYVAAVYMAIDLISEGYSTSASTISGARRVVRLALVYGAVLALCVLVKGEVFHENVNFTLAKRLSASTMPINDPMLSFFFPDAPVPSWRSLVLKMTTNLRSQLLPDAKSMVFAIPVNILVAYSFVSVWKYRYGTRPLFLMSAGCGVIYVAVILIYQVQFRYALFALPVLLAAMVFDLSSRLGTSNLKRGAICLITLQLCLSPLLLNRIRDRGREQSREIEEIRVSVARISPDTPVLFEMDPSRHDVFMLFSYAVSPRRVAVIRGGDFACLQYQEVKPYLTGDFVVASYDDKLLGLAGPSDFKLVSSEFRGYRVVQPKTLCNEEQGDVTLGRPTTLPRFSASRDIDRSTGRLDQVDP